MLPLNSQNSQIWQTYIEIKDPSLARDQKQNSKGSRLKIPPVLNSLAFWKKMLLWKNIKSSNFQIYSGTILWIGYDCKVPL